MLTNEPNPNAVDRRVRRLDRRAAPPELVKLANVPEPYGDVVERELSDMHITTHADVLRYAHQEIDQLRAALAAKAAECEQLKVWEREVTDQLVCCHIYHAERHKIARCAVNELIDWNCKVALDPRVSSDAAALVDQSARELAEAQRRVAELERVLKPYVNSCRKCNGVGSFFVPGEGRDPCPVCYDARKALATKDAK